MSNQIIPTVGMGGSYGFNGDCYPITVIEVVNKKTIIIQNDNYEVIEKDACYKEGRLKCKFSPNPNSIPKTVTLRRNGRWVVKGDEMRSAWGSIYLGERAFARNPHV